MRLLCWLSLSLTLAITGCDRSSGLPFTSEDNDPDYTRGKQLIRQGREQEALAAFLRVIATRNDEAPESHLEAALLYQQQLKDPIAAIYHFRKYLELQPNSRQAVLVRQRIDAAKREFARTLPAHPLEDASVKLEFMDQLEHLQRENDDLKAEISALRAGLPEGAVPVIPRTRRTSTGFVVRPPEASAPAPAPEESPAPAQALSEAEPIAAEDSPVMHAPMPVEMVAPSEHTRVSVPSRAPTSPSRPGATTPAPAAATGKRHAVQRGDTLYSLAQKYYGNRSRWRDIYGANQDILRSEGDTLRIGMELRIP